jgi:hypothetical protein
VSPIPTGATAFTHTATGWRELSVDAELQPGEAYLLQVE